ncbi:MAG TPA: transposase, partial [Hanamia sp.]|nr:transposase [Hanamia sp.]
SGIKVTARLVIYKDLISGELYEFLSNNFRKKATTIARLYQQRWQIELLFKRMKQNYLLKYFLGDSENAIQIQIWCSLIADLILKIIKKGAAAKWFFSNLAAMVRIHLMTYINLGGFLRSPEKALMKLVSQSKQYNHNQLLLIT